MHTNDMLTGRCLCLYVELETVFTFGHLTKPGACRSTIEDRSPTTSDRVSFSDLVEVVVQWSICMLMKEDTKMSLFQPNCRIENCTPRSFSATTSQSRPLNACHYTTQQALSVHLCSIVSTPSLPYLDEKSKIVLTLGCMVRRVSTHVYVRCMSAGTLLITTVPSERASSSQ